MPAKGSIPEAVTEALDALKASINEFSVDFTSKLDTITTKLVALETRVSTLEQGPKEEPLFPASDRITPTGVAENPARSGLDPAAKAKLSFPSDVAQLKASPSGDLKISDVMALYQACQDFMKTNQPHSLSLLHPAHAPQPPHSP